MAVTKEEILDAISEMSVMDVVEVVWDDGETRGQITCELELLNEAR